MAEGGVDPFGDLPVLEGVRETRNSLGRGSFGEVIEIMYGETLYAAKKIHSDLVSREVEGANCVRDNYARECRLLSGLRHGNVTEFTGLYYQPGHDDDLPLLVMELLRISLHKLLETEPDVPLQMKLSFLHDVSAGLHYLHGQNVLHRDLTAKNVLLTEDLRVAKISDMGTSRIVCLPLGGMATLTSVPGTWVYMPPEATDTSAKTRYGPSLDIFSFGVLALFTFTQDFPGELQPPTYVDENRITVGRSEVERREHYIEDLHQKFVAHPEIKKLVENCLDNCVEERPETEILLEQVRSIKDNLEEENLTVDRTRDLSVRAVVAGLELRQLQARVNEFEKSKDMENKELLRKLDKKDDELQKVKVEMEKMVNIEKEKLKECQKKLDEKELELKNIKAISAMSPSLQGPLNVDWPHGPEWQHGPDMLFGVSDYVQSVALQDGLYVGGGWCRKRIDNNFIIIKYDFQSKVWVQLKVAYTARDFAMVAVRGHLVLVGGCDRTNCDTDTLGMWSSEDTVWQTPYPPMLTARHNASAVCFKKYLIVVGGLKQGPVEVLDLDADQWVCVPGSVPWHSMKSALVGDTWCLMGGYRELKSTSEFFAISLPALVSLATTTTGNDQTYSFECKEFCGTGLTFSTPVNIKGYLFAVGGKQDDTTGDTIKCFMSSGKWQDVGKFPCPLFNCTCTCYDGLIYVAAGTMRQKCSKLFVGSIPSL